MGYGLRIEIRTWRTTIVDIFDIIQKEQDTGIHLKVDEEQWKITQEVRGKQVGMVPTCAMSGLRLPDTPHAQ